MRTSGMAINTWLTRVLLVVCVALYAGHLWVICANAVNVPFWDEWGFLRPDGMPAGLTAGWLFGQENEHRIVLTKLLAWALLRTTGWDLVANIVVTYVIYGALLACIFLFARRVVPHLPAWVTLAFTPFLLSPINWENHFWGIQSSYHLAMLFSLLAAYLLLGGEQTRGRLLAGAVCAVLAAYSFLSGLVAAVVLLAAFALFKVVRGRLAGGGGERRREYVELAAVAAPALVLMALYFVGFRSVPGHPQPALPHTASFWAYYSNLVSWGFGFETESVVLGVACLLLVVAPAVLEIRARGWRLPASSWAVHGFTLAALCVLASIAVGRAGADIPRAKISRYSDFAMMLIPCSVFAWAVLLRERAALRRYVLVGLWVLCCVGFSYKWLWFSVYRQQGEARREGVRCIRAYYERGGPARCPTVSPVDIGPMLEEAKKLNLSFYREAAGGR